MAKKQSGAEPHTCPARVLENMARFWALRMLVKLGAWQSLSTLCSDETFKWLGMREFIEDAPARRVLKARCAQRLREVERSRPNLPAGFEDALGRLAESIGLDRTERQILGFAVVLHSHRALDDVADELGILSTPAVCASLADLLRLPVQDVRAALSRSGLLNRAGLLSLYGGSHLRSCLQLFDGLPSLLMDARDGAGHILSAFFRPAPESQLHMKDYTHLGEDARILTSYLRTALRDDCRGVNVLLYGPPGTGKTEFARVLARSVRATAYEVSTERLDAEPLEGHKRFDAYRLSQVALEKKRRSVIVFDEIEDVFPDPALEFGRGRSRKAWVNRVLETNPTPAIWISNRIDQMDPAYLRRFDFVMQIDQPPREVRARILRDQLGQVPVRDEWLEGVASHQQLSPGLIATAAKVVALAGSEAEASNEERLERVVGNTLRAMGRPTTPTRVTKARVPYSQDFLNVDVDLSALIHGLKRRPEGRLCLYGLPGTGKTALVRHLSEVLQRPLISKSASDLLAPYVGQTEAQLAEMFEQARKDGAVLFLDEADSFLRDRREGRHSWEVTQVNELLVQMERFDGLFVCATNLMDSVDRAALRRFDFRVRFDCMTAEQARRLLEQVSVSNAPAVECEDGHHSSLLDSGQLVPGDFAVVLRRLELLGVAPTVQKVTEELARELEARRGCISRPIGFHT